MFSWPLAAFCACTCSGVGSLGLLVRENLLFAHPAHDQRNTDALATCTVPRFWVPAPLNVSGAPVVCELDVADAVVTVLVTVWVVVRLMTLGGCLTVTVRAGAVTVWTLVTVLGGLVTVFAGVVTVLVVAGAVSVVDAVTVAVLCPVEAGVGFRAAPAITV